MAETGNWIIFKDSGERRFPKKNEHYTFIDGPEAGTVFNNENYGEWDAKESDPTRVAILTATRNDFDPRSQAEKTLARIHEILNAGAARRDRAGKDLDKAAHYQQVVTEIVTELMAAEELPVKRLERGETSGAYYAHPLAADSQLYHHGMRAIVFIRGRAPIAACFLETEAQAVAAALNAMENSK